MQIKQGFCDRIQAASRHHSSALRHELFSSPWHGCLTLSLQQLTKCRTYSRLSNRMTKGMALPDLTVLACRPLRTPGSDHVQGTLDACVHMLRCLTFHMLLSDHLFECKCGRACWPLTRH